MPPRWASASATTASIAVFVVLLLFISRLPGGRCQGFGANPPPAPLLVPQLISEVNTLTQNIFPVIQSQFRFCVKDIQQDWDQTFNYTSGSDFLVDCQANTDDMTARLCSAAEVKFYFDNFIESGGNTNYMRPNINCNSTSWVPGCEPGWASAVGSEVVPAVDYKGAESMPPRVLDSRPCCAGFYCPSGITCMIPCPLGAYCPRAKINETTGRCDPYKYQLPPGQSNHTCGGADIWADVDHSSDLFCPAGHFCPSTIVKNNCSSGHYCRMGSTGERSCYKSSTCDANSETQNITVFGGLLMVALILLLLIMYNFSDQILTYRERRQAKSREAAARVAREAVQARERWKAAKNIAVRHTVEFQKSISRTFSRRRSNKLPEQHKVIGLSRQPSDASPSEIEELDMLGTVTHSSEEDCDNAEVLNSNPGEKQPKKSTTKGKHMHTRTQIFKYAYSEIEKEKVLQREKMNLTFSGLISLATKSEVRTRPVIEITFKNLTLVLKRNKRQLLKSVTGKLTPGHVTAIMGPSGAGKTTFLTALAGKTAGCQMTGLVLINGKVEPIHSYKKIIGFVPQDDIVHGNLTVHENLWFSARCRLAADVSKADKVLIVERTIESLGLQAVRDSLVGTVEKRGISGGQRKRVNVGLEMVMEPSLLILDEPTSGLDSSSSLLLMRALRREALEGVNVCMVVHQPSYTLFSMFDDLILLAKGGLIAYQGPVKKVEEYFADLEIQVPERVNPPDYFIDILEGIVKPSTSTGVKPNQLPLIWMLRNGYNVPHDMQNELDSVHESFRGGTSSSRSGSDVESGATGVWGDAKEGDNFEHNFLKSKDLANRRTPGKLKQYKYYLGRVSKQRLREATAQAVDYLILGLAGVCLGILAKANDSNLGAAGYTYASIAVSLLGQIGALRSFSIEKLQYLRERRSGMSSLAYFLARDTVDHLNTIVKPVVFLSMFYFFSNPRSSFADNYIVFLALVYCVTGIGYTFAICFQPGSAQLWSALLPVVLTLISTQRRNSKILNLCYPKWALEAFVIINAKRYSGVWIITRCGLLAKFNYDINNWGLCLGVLFLYGFVFRCVAFVCLVLLNKK